MIQKRGSRWRVVVNIRTPDSFDRRRRQLSGSTATEAAARRLEAEFKARAARAAQDGENFTLSEVVEAWWASRPRLAPTTIANYRDNLDNHILPAMGHRRVIEIRPRLVTAFLSHLLKEKGLGPATVRKVRTVLSAVMAWATAMEYVESNPVMKVAPPELAEGTRETPTVEETARILMAAEELDPDFLDFLWLAAELGGRRGEVLGLRWCDVDVAAGRVVIRQVVSIGEDGVNVRARTKTGKPRPVSLSLATTARLVARRARLEALRESVGAPSQDQDHDELVFTGGLGSRRTPLDGRPWRPDSTSRRFKRLKEAAGVSSDIDLHGLRHMMVTELIGAGVDPRTVMERAGHSSEAVTMGVYARMRPGTDAPAAEAWGRALQAEMDRLKAGVSGQGLDDDPEAPGRGQ